jgi:hypothetical protein
VSSKHYPCRCLGRVARKTATKHDGKYRTCDARRSLRKRPSQYAIQPKCKQCGSRKWGIDKYRLHKERGSENTCYCEGRHFVHRKGSKYCVHHPRYEEDWAVIDKRAIDGAKESTVKIGSDYCGFADMVDSFEAL